MAGSPIEAMTRDPDLRKRLLYTLVMLAIYRIGSFITVPGVDREIMANYIRFGQTGLLGLFDMFSGGAISQMSIFALGVMPYISASIIFQLLTVVVPALERLQKEGEAGRRKINEYTRYATVGLSAIQGVGIAVWLESLNYESARGLLHGIESPFLFKFMTILSLTVGTMFLMWMGERITERGIGNGVSLIIFAGIVARLPDAVVQTIQLSSIGGTGGRLEPLTLIVIGILIVVTIGVIVFFERGQRRIPIQYAKKVVGRKLYGGQTTFLPLKVNTSGVIPPIFASSILMFPSTLYSLFPGATWVAWLQSALVPGHMLYNVLYVILIIFFCYFYTAVMFNPVDVADNLKKGGGFIPGIRAGKTTAEYIDKVLSRITFGGAVYVAAVCVLPTLLQTQFGVPFYFGGTSLLIVVGVAMDTASQIEGYAISRSYEGFAGAHGPRMRGRREQY